MAWKTNVIYLAGISLVWGPLIYGWTHPSKVLETEFAYRPQIDSPFFTYAEINGVPTLAMLDTGASAVAMSMRAARVAGVRLAGAKYPYEIADGRIVLCQHGTATVTVGAIKVSNVLVSACPRVRGRVLLGQSFLSRLRVTTDHTPYAKLELMGE